jgi:hypothetical protein
MDGYDEQTNEIIPIYAVEYPRRRIFTEKYFADHGMAGRIVHTQMPILLNSVEDIDNSGINFELYGTAPTEPTQSILAVPMLRMKSNRDDLGNRIKNAYTSEDQYLLILRHAHH